MTRDHSPRGTLKVYLGSAAGVGKTYRMLAEGRQLADRGVDVVIGYMEPHERPDTIAQAAGLEVVPPRLARYHNLELKELDVDGVVDRHPRIALVDELAHTNAPGSRNEKRYQDVQELLDAGIDVITTLNIQHLESLYNIVEGATGVQVAERIPDAVVAQADLIVNVDIEADELIERLRAGKIYRSDRIDAALGNFFTVANLTRLRELALSETANLLDRRQRERLDVGVRPSALNKVMVRIRGGEPNAEAILRSASRLASQLNAQWYVVHVSTSADEARALDPQHDEIAAVMRLSQSMGAENIILKDDNIGQALIQFARANGITHLVQGHPARRGLFAKFRKSITDILIEALPEIHLTMI
ncbi:MAG TPA: histidine kinase [Candidatus Paceibacterota bacterium]|nr:histidine kinase [Candidatus Paceibacterota bacterium]